MPQWSDIWHVCDLSYLARMFFSSYVANNVDFVRKTVDSVISNITWVLEHEPARMFVALDSGDSERRRIHPLYKISRPTPPPEYYGCYDAILHDLRENFSDAVEIVGSPGWESDDIMATVAKEATGLGLRTILMSNDKDLRQCLRPGKVVIQLRKRNALGDATEWRFFNTQDAETDWQCLWQRFIDYQVLVGDDQVDRIEGAPGVGPKTASELLIQYDSVANMKTIEIPGALGKKLAEFWKKEPTTRSLVTLRDSIPIFNVVTGELVDFSKKVR